MKQLIANKILLILLMYFLTLVVCASVLAKPTYQAKHQPGSSEAVITLYDTLPAYILQSDQGWTRLYLEGQRTRHTEQPDHPQLPYLEYWISVPENTELIDVEVKAQAGKVSLNQPVMPVQKPFIPGPGVVPPQLSADPQVYQSDKEYPLSWYDHEIKRMGSTQMLVLKVYVFKYVGSFQRLITYQDPKIQIRLRVSNWSSNSVPKNRVDQEIKKQLVNPKEAFFGTPLR
jgi:hypothetical protein